MNELKITKGKASSEINKHFGTFEVYVSDHFICDMGLSDVPTGEDEGNTGLVCDAFNTANETGLLPSELKKQRDELLSACLMAKEELVFGGDWKNAKRVVEQAINNTKQK